MSRVFSISLSVSNVVQTTDVNRALLVTYFFNLFCHFLAAFGACWPEWRSARQLLLVLLLLSQPSSCKHITWIGIELEIFKNIQTWKHTGSTLNLYELVLACALHWDLWSLDALWSLSDVSCNHILDVHFALPQQMCSSKCSGQAHGQWRRDSRASHCGESCVAFSCRVHSVPLRI